MGVELETNREVRETGNDNQKLNRLETKNQNTKLNHYNS